MANLSGHKHPNSLDVFEQGRSKKRLRQSAEVVELVARLRNCT